MYGQARCPRVGADGAGIAYCLRCRWKAACIARPGALESDIAGRGGHVCMSAGLVLPEFQTGLVRLRPGSPKVGSPPMVSWAP